MRFQIAFIIVILMCSAVFGVVVDQARISRLDSIASDSNSTADVINYSLAQKSILQVKANRYEDANSTLITLINSLPDPNQRMAARLRRCSLQIYHMPDVNVMPELASIISDPCTTAINKRKARLYRVAYMVRQDDISGVLPMINALHAASPNIANEQIIAEAKVILYGRSGNLTAMQKAIDDYLATSPTKVQELAIVARGQRFKQKYADPNNAIDRLQTEIAVAKYRMALVYYSQKKDAQAAPIFIEVKGTMNTEVSGQAGFMLGEIYKRAGKLTEAKAEYQWLIDNFPACPLYNLAVAKIRELQ